MGLVAREAELAAIAAVLDSDATSVRALVLEGEPGVGKTSLWEQAVTGGHERGMRILAARASESETRLLSGAQYDLLDGVSSDQLASAPAPQLHALEVALSPAGPGEAPPTDH